MPRPFCIIALALSFVAAASAQNAPQTNDASQAFLNFVKARAAELRANDKPPASLADWSKQRAELRANLMKAWGDRPKQPAPLNPKKLGELQRDGYRVEKIIFQTFPGVWMTANTYVPDKPGKLPAVLCVHGHWRGAKQDPVVQSRCIGLAKLGFFVLVVDAFGAGERGISKNLGEYHGEMVAATLFPVGLPLSGLQVYENMRAVDYLLTRPEVDGARLGITGASGGGNQTMYAGAFDERFKAVVPVCSVGNYQAYLGAACCMCEVVPGALRFTEEWGLLALVAPRALMVVSATKDAPQFSVAAAKKSLALAQPVFALHGQPENMRHAIFESPHDYSRAMREAMYGWMTKHLKGEGDGSPIPEPEIKTEDPETLRCFPGQTRPDDWMTIPKFAAGAGNVALMERSPSVANFERHKPIMLAALRDNILRLPRFQKLDQERAVFRAGGGGSTKNWHDSISVEPESSNWQLQVSVNSRCPSESFGAILLVSLENRDFWTKGAIGPSANGAGLTVAELWLRNTMLFETKNDHIGRAPDHNSAEWSLWLGRPLLGQWLRDLEVAVDVAPTIPFNKNNELTVVGVGPAGVVALCAAALDQRITRVVTVGSLASYISDVPYEGQRLGIMAPGIVRDVGDIPQLASLIAPRKLIIAGGVTGGGKPLDEAALKKQFEFTQRVYEIEKAASALTILSSTNATDIVRALK
ncbi:MAG: acetylxylan esterase [Verrucomicrobia bacterium]|nr:acetylxylan esterase [Verrucomicrobiota bacterium]